MDDYTLIRLLETPDPLIRKEAAQRAGKKRLADLLGAVPVPAPVVQALQEMGAKPSELLAHPNPMTRVRAARFFVPRLMWPQDKQEVLAVLRHLASEHDDEVAQQALRGLAGVIQGTPTPDVIDALAEAIENLADIAKQEAIFWVHRIAAMGQFLNVRSCVFRALGRLAKMRNEVGFVATERLMDWAKVDRDAAAVLAQVK